MRILITTAELGYRGTPRVVGLYARMLAKSHEVAIWGWREGGIRAEDLKQLGFTVFVGEADEDNAIAFKPDVLNIHRPGLPHSREGEIMAKFKAQGARIIETNVFGRVDLGSVEIIDYTINISKWNYCQWRSWLGKVKLRGGYVPNPVDVDAFKRCDANQIERFRRSIRIPDGAFLVGRIGNTSWDMLSKPLQDAMDKVQRLYFVNVRDHIGANIPKSISEHERVRELPKIGNDGALCEFYSACDLCVSMSSIGESFGLTIAESMCCGTPVVTVSTPFHCNAQVEVVTHGEGGLVLSSPNGFPDAVSRLVAHPDELSRYRQRCRGIIEKRYSMQAIEGVLRRIFEECADAPCDGNAIDDAIRQKEGKFPWWYAGAMKLLYTPMTYQLLLQMKRRRK